MQHSKKRNEQNREESLTKDIELLEKNYTRENEDEGIAGVKKKENGGNADTIKI